MFTHLEGVGGVLQDEFEGAIGALVVVEHLG